MRILLLEDHGESRNVIANLLGHCGYTVSAAGSLAEATALLETDCFDVLLSDIGLLDGDAFDLVKTARARPALKLIVALTGRIADEDRQRAREAGFDHYLTKPVDFHELRQLLAETQ